jgi:hypothetical protein
MVLKAVIAKIAVFCSVKLCNSLGRYKRFGGIFCLYLQGKRRTELGVLSESIGERKRV